MSAKKLPIKNIIYLAILSIALVFSLYNLFSNDARSWFVINKRVVVDPIYGRVLTTGAGRNLSSFKNNEGGSPSGPISLESAGDTYLTMVPGDIIHFIFLVSVPDAEVPPSFSGSTLNLHEVFGDPVLRDFCLIAAGTISLTSVSCAEVEVEGETKVQYTYGGEDPVYLPNAPLGSLATEAGSGDIIQLSIGEFNEDNIVWELVEVGPYDGSYLFLLDIPVLYVDDGTNQNSHKGGYEYESDAAGNTTATPVPDGEAGRIIIARCSFTFNS